MRKDPERGFDRSRVKGLVAKLINLKDPSTATAIEVVAGSKLYQVGLLPTIFPIHLGFVLTVDVDMVLHVYTYTHRL